MNWIGDKILLLVVGVVGAAGSWVLLAYSGKWFFLVCTLIAFLSLFSENDRLRRLLREHGIDPKRKRYVDGERNEKSGN